MNNRFFFIFSTYSVRGNKKSNIRFVGSSGGFIYVHTSKYIGIGFELYSSTALQESYRNYCLHLIFVLCRQDFSAFFFTLKIKEYNKMCSFFLLISSFASRRRPEGRIKNKKYRPFSISSLSRATKIARQMMIIGYFYPLCVWGFMVFFLHSVHLLILDNIVSIGSESKLNHGKTLNK